MEENEKMNEICQSDDYGGDDGNGINVTKGFCMGKSEKANQQPHHHFGQKKALSWLLLVSPLISAVTIMAIAMTIYSVMSLPHQFYAIRNLDFLIAIFVPPFIQVVIFVTFYFIATKIKTNRIYQLYEVIFLIFVIISSLLMITFSLIISILGVSVFIIYNYTYIISVNINHAIWFVLNILIFRSIFRNAKLRNIWEE